MMSDAIENRARSPRISGGLIDAVVGAMATFLASAYAVRVLAPEALGAHALMFAAVILLGTVPERLVFLPTLAVSVQQREAARFGYYREGLRLAAPLLPLVGAFVIVYFLLPVELSGSERLALTVAGAAAAVFQSGQLFARQTLHYAGRPGGAIVASLLRLGVTAIALGLASQSGLPLVAVPLLGIAAGNLAATGWAAMLHPPDQVARLSRRLIYARGSYLVVSGAVPAAAAFVTANLVIAFGGAALLGFAEAARVIAQPVFVGATGLALVTNPRVMAAAVSGDTDPVVRARRLYLALLWAGGVGYAVVLALPGIGSLVESLLPTAFEITGLIAVSILAQIALGLTRPYAAEAIALERERAVLVSELPGAAIVIGFGLAVPIVGAFAIPAGLAGAGFARTGLLRNLLRTESVPSRDGHPLPEEIAIGDGFE